MLKKRFLVVIPLIVIFSSLGIASTAQALPVIHSSVGDPTSAYYANGWRVFMSCGGKTPNDLSCGANGSTATNENFRSPSTYNMNAQTTANFLLGGSASLGTNGGIIHITDISANSSLFSSTYFVVTYVAGQQYFDINQVQPNLLPGAALNKPSFTCALTCPAQIYVAFVPLGKYYDGSGSVLGDNGKNPSDPGVATFGSVTNKISAGSPSSPSSGPITSPICNSFSSSDPACTASLPTSITDCVNINPLAFKVDFPCLMSLLFIPSQSSVTSLQSKVNLVFTTRQPFIFFSQAITNGSTIYNTALNSTGCSPFTYDFPLFNNHTFHMVLFQCIPSLQGLIKPLTTTAIWLFIFVRLAIWIFKKVDPGLGVGGGVD